MAYFQTGDCIRVLAQDNKSSRKAIVSYVDDSGLVDVVYLSKGELELWPISTVTRFTCTCNCAMHLMVQLTL